MAAVSPAGPAPTTSTGTSSARGLVSGFVMASLLRRGRPAEFTRRAVFALHSVVWKTRCQVKWRHEPVGDERQDEPTKRSSVSARRYEQRLRAETAEATRRRVLDAVASELRSAPTEPVSLDRVARRARVARSTIYLVFGSRAGLFDAFAEDLWARSGLADLTRAVEHPDAREHLRGGIRASC